MKPEFSEQLCLNVRVMLLNKIGKAQIVCHIEVFRASDGVYFCSQ